MRSVPSSATACLAPLYSNALYATVVVDLALLAVALAAAGARIVHVTGSGEGRETRAASAVAELLRT